MSVFHHIVCRCNNATWPHCKAKHKAWSDNRRHILCCCLLDWWLFGVNRLKETREAVGQFDTEHWLKARWISSSGFVDNRGLPASSRKVNGERQTRRGQLKAFFAETVFLFLNPSNTNRAGGLQRRPCRRHGVGWLIILCDDDPGIIERIEDWLPWVWSSPLPAWVGSAEGLSLLRFQSLPSWNQHQRQIQCLLALRWTQPLLAPYRIGIV